MDPLSLTASVAGIVQLAGAVYQGIAKYIRDVRGASREIEDLAVELRNVFGILNNLSLLISTLEHDHRLSALNDSHLNALRRTLYTLDLQVSRAARDLDGGSKPDAIFRRLRWPFSKDETKDLLRDMTRHKDNISLALSADSMTRLIEIISTQQTLQSSVDGVTKSVENLQATVDTKTEIVVRAVLTQNRRDVINFFQAVNPQSKYETCVEMRQDMTGLWLLKDKYYQTWIEQPDGRIWLSGIPGSGKTILCGAIIQDVLQRSTPTTAVAFFFCDYAVKESQEPIQILGSLAVQLALQKPEAFAVLEKLYNDCHPPNGHVKLLRLADMTKVLSQLLGEFDEAYIVVDALDECGSNATNVASVLRNIALSDSNASIALLSRDETPIRDILDDDFHNLQIAAQAEDLTIYLGAQMGMRRVFSTMLVRNPDLYGHIRRFLLDGAQGMFRWVACELDYLEKLPSNGLRKKALDKTPKTLFQMYQRILDNAFDDVDGENEAARDLARKTLHWIAISSPPLTIGQLRQAVSLHDDDDNLHRMIIVEEDEIARVCSSLIRKTRDGRRFEFAHFTVREFLESLSPSSSLAEFRLDPVSAARSLSMTALRFLLLQHDGPLSNDIYADLEIEGYNGRPSFYSYAAAHWFYYANGHFQDKQILHLADRLFAFPKTSHFYRFASAVLRYVMDTKLDSTNVGGTVDFSEDNFTPLHLAAILGLPELCTHLVQEKGFDVNVRSSQVGFALDAAQAGLWALSLQTSLPFRDLGGSRKIETVKALARCDACSMLERESMLAYGEKTISGEPSGPLAMFRRLGDASICANIIANGFFNGDFVDFLREGLLLSEPSDPFAKSLVHEICNLTCERPNASKMILSLVTAAIDIRAQLASVADYDMQASQMAGSQPVVTSAFLLEIMNSHNAKGLKVLLECQFQRCCELRFGEQKRSLLHLAVSSRQLAFVKVLLAASFPVNTTDDNGDTALHLCTTVDHVLIAKLLIENGANTVLANKSGSTIWHLATAPGSARVLDLLTSCVSDLSSALGNTDTEGYTPISLAVRRSCWAAAQFLVKNSDCHPSYFQCPQPLAKFVLQTTESLPFLNALEEEKAIAKCFCRDGDPSPLIYAKFHSEPDIVKLFVSYGAELPYKGKTAFEFAFESYLEDSDGPRLRNRVFGLLLKPLLKSNKEIQGLTLWEYLLLFPLSKPNIGGSEHLRLFQAVLLYSDDLCPAFQASHIGTNAMAPLLLPLWILHRRRKFKLYRQGETDDEALSQVLGIEMAASDTTPHLIRKISDAVNQRRRPSTLARHIFALRDETGFLRHLASQITVNDLAACDINIFARICASLTPGDSKASSYFFLKNVTLEPRVITEKSLSMRPIERIRYTKISDMPLTWPKPSWPQPGHDDEFDWKQTFDIIYDDGRPPLKGCNLLHAAAFHGLTCIAMFLLDSDLFDVDVKSTEGLTPWDFASIGSNLEAQLFLEAIIKRQSMPDALQKDPEEAS